MKRISEFIPRTMIIGVSALIGLAVGAAFVSAREPAKAPAPTRSVEPFVEYEAFEDAPLALLP